MKIGFFTDGTLFIDSNGNINGVAFNDKLYARYLSFADELELCMRKKNVAASSGLSKITLPKVHFTPCPNLSSATFFFHKRKAIKVIKEVLSKCDGAVIRLPGRISQLAAKLCEKMNKPYVIEMVGCPWDALWNHSIKGKLVALPFALQTKSATKKAPAVLYVTKEFLQRRYPTNGIQIGCSDVELHPAEDSILEKRLKKINEHNGKKFIIGTTAAVDVRYKGQQYVIEALGYLKKNGITNFVYQLVGNGDQSFLKKIARKNDVEDQVKFLGGISHEEIFDWLDSIDIYVQPSRQEGLPRALVEAMSRGLPAFGARTGGIPELLDENQIFRNSNKNIKEIAGILQAFDRDKMIKQAKRNFELSHDYQKRELEEKRINFYKEYFLKAYK